MVYIEIRKNLFQSHPFVNCIMYVRFINRCQISKDQAVQKTSKSLTAKNLRSFYSTSFWLCPHFLSKITKFHTWFHSQMYYIWWDLSSLSKRISSLYSQPGIYRLWLLTSSFQAKSIFCVVWRMFSFSASNNSGRKTFEHIMTTSSHPRT